ncbi:MAG: putative quinol monooxygenase [Acidiferrobacterales bacterium]
MNHFAVIVMVKVKPGTSGDFRAQILTNAEASSRNEPDCHRFDVLVSEDDESTFFFYEEYTDAAAFDTHHNMDHYKAFRAATDAIVVDRKIERCAVIS